MNKFLNGRNLVIGIITLAFGVLVAVGISKVWTFQTTVSGNVASFILNREGKPDGAILDTGDQIKFGAQTGELVASQIKIGDALSASGRAGSSTNYGRELQAKTLQIGDQTITVVGGAKPPRDDKRKGDKPRPPRPPKDGDAPRPEPKGAPQPEAGNAPQPEINNGEMPPAPTPKETAKVASNVKFVLVGAEGEARGLILADGTQIDLPKEVKDAELTFSDATQVAVEGEVSKGDFGAFIKPNVLTIDNQTFSFNR